MFNYAYEQYLDDGEEGRTGGYVGIDRGRTKAISSLERHTARLSQGGVPATAGRATATHHPGGGGPRHRWSDPHLPRAQQACSPTRPCAARPVRRSKRAGGRVARTLILPGAARGGWSP